MLKWYFNKIALHSYTDAEQVTGVQEKQFREYFEKSFKINILFSKAIEKINLKEPRKTITQKCTPTTTLKEAAFSKLFLNLVWYNFCFQVVRGQLEPNVWFRSMARIQQQKF